VASDVPGDPTSYRWDFGDGTSLTTSYQSALYSYTCFGTVTATVTVTDSAGATGSATQQVTVTPEQGFPACAPRAARDAHAPLGLFAARFTHARVIRIAGLTRARGVTTVHGLVMAGRLEGQLFGSRAPGSAAAARWTALLTLVEDPARRTAILRGFALARLGRGGGTACLRVNLTRHGNGVARGSFAVLGATGMLARVSGGGSFAYLLGRDLTGRLAGRLHVGRARPRLRPPACRALRALPDRP
jgi:PKD repeat protein